MQAKASLPFGFDELSNGLACAVVVRDGSGRVLYINESARQIYGSIDESEEVDRTVKRIREDGIDYPYEDMAVFTALSTGEPQRNRVHGVVSEDGSVRWLRADLMPVADAQGHVVATVASATDVTELKAAQEQVRQQEAYFHALVENMADAISVVDADNRLLYKSPSSQQAGATALSVGDDGFNVLHPDDLEKAQELFRRALRKPGERISGSVRCRAEDGSWRWLRGAMVNRLADPAVRGIVVNWRDVTQRREERERERMANQRWQRLVTETYNAIISLDLDGKVLSWNPGAERIFGWIEAEVVGQVLPWVPAEERQRKLELLREVRVSGKTEIYETDRLTKDGRRVPVLGTLSSLITDDNGSCNELILILADMTVHKQAEEQAKLVALLEERDRIAMELHDGVIQSLYALALTLSVDSHAANPESIQFVERATAQINEIIRDIRSYIFDLRPERLAEHDVAEGLELLAQELRKASQMRIVTQLDPEVSSHLRPAVTNELLHIAREATSNVVRHARASQLDVRLEQARNTIVLSIRDNGQGFDPTDVDAKRGDGITNMQARARALGGSTHLISSERKGTVVRVELPVPEIQGPVLDQPIRILVVDDHKVVRLGLVRIFEDAAGVEVVGEAGGVEEAISAARRLQPNVVLMDVRLPDGSGVDACRVIRSERPETKVIMLTSYSDEDAVLASIMAGASGYLLKENAPGQLIQTVEKVAAGASLLDQSSVQSAMKLLRQTDSEFKDDPLAKLTPQEGKVLRLMAEGKTNREIARVLALSEHTVRTYASSIFSKLRITRRAEAAAIAVRRQLS